MPVSERLRSRWDPSRLAHHGDLRLSQWSKPQELHRPPFEWKNKSLLWYPFRCVEWKVTSVTAAEFCGAVIPSDLHVPVNSAVVHSKNTRLEQFVFYLVMWKNSRVFMSHNSAEVHWTFHFKILYWRLKNFNLTYRTILVCKLSQIVNFVGLTLLTAFVLYSQSDYLNHSNRDSDWLIVACFMRV